LAALAVTLAMALLQQREWREAFLLRAQAALVVVRRLPHLLLRLLLLVQFLAALAEQLCGLAQPVPTPQMLVLVAVAEVAA
jgi:hypothetical protein